jgi:Fic family protein
LPATTIAGIANLYFKFILPFEGNNGRIELAIAEKTMAQSFGQCLFVALATTILAHQKNYYETLERANQQIDVISGLRGFLILPWKHRAGLSRKSSSSLPNKIAWLPARPD